MNLRGLLLSALIEPPRPCLHRSTWARFAAILLLTAACHPGPLQRRPSWAQEALKHAEPEDEAHAHRLWEAANAAEAARDPAGALAMRADLLKRFGTTEAAALLYEKQAQQAVAAGDNAVALDALEHILFLRPQFVRADAAKHAYAVALVHAERADEALAIFAGMGQDSSERDGLAQDLLQPLLAKDRHKAAIELMVSLRGSSRLSALDKQKLGDWAVEVASTTLSLAEAEQLYNEHGSSAAWAFVRPTLAVKVADAYVRNGDDTRARAPLADLRAHFANTPQGALGLQLEALMQARDLVEPMHVGVLLPLSGRFKQFGERSRVAIELAFAGSPNIKLFIKDTQGEPDKAAEAIDSLVLEHHVIAAIGPLFSGEALAAAQKAQALSLPLISLSHQEGLCQTGDHIFRTALTVSAQARALAATAFEQLGMTRFAIMAPRSRYGNDFLQAFWDEVEARHGFIRGVESYAPEQTTFREPVRRLVGRWFMNARPEFRESLKALKERELSGMRMRSEVDRLDKRSPPIVDFEGLVIPDSGRQLGLIAPALAFEDIALSRDARALDKMRRALSQNEITPITLLGASTWNNQQTLDSCEQYCENAVFVDGYFSGSTNTAVRDFVSGFQQQSGAEPLLSEAQAFDTGGLIVRLLTGRRQVNTRQKMVQALHDFEFYPGVCGRMHFDAQGEVQRELQVLTIHGHRIEPLSARNNKAAR